MFINLCRDASIAALFAGHNFHTSGGRLTQVADPSHDVELALRDQRGYLPNGDLIPTLSFTLSPACCSSFIRAHAVAKPVADRDYYLSKLYQFFSIALLDQGCEAAYFEEASHRLENLLDSLFPDRESVPSLGELDWLRIFADYKKRDLELSISKLRSYLPNKSRFRQYANGAQHLGPHTVSVNMTQAAGYLDRSERQIRNLVTDGKLKTVGKGLHKRITADSLRSYKGETLPLSNIRN